MAQDADQKSLGGAEPALPRSDGAISERRKMLPWPEDREFRILSIDGGGIRGIFPAAILAGLEQRFLGGSSVADYFDLITGASTGGIIAIGLGAGLTAGQLRDMYVERGSELFDPRRRVWNKAFRVLAAPYKTEVLAGIMEDILGNRLFGESRVRLCVPAFEGEYGEVFVFKTPHHPDFKEDWRTKMTKVALATSAAPTYLRPLQDGGYAFVDGGVWANNPIMVGLVDALSCFAIRREQVRILSLGCGSEYYRVGPNRRRLGGIAPWGKIIFAAMHLQSQSALGQTELLIGKDRVTRLDVSEAHMPMALDDWKRAVTELPGDARERLDECGLKIRDVFLSEPCVPYTPYYFGC